MGVRVVATRNNMPIYNVKCEKCGDFQEMYFGSSVDGAKVKILCKCGHTVGKCIPTPINNANFSKGSSKRSLKTRTGVGEIQFKRGAKKKIEEANKE